MLELHYHNLQFFQSSPIGEDFPQLHLEHRLENVLIQLPPLRQFGSAEALALQCKGSGAAGECVQVMHLETYHLKTSSYFNNAKFKCFMMILSV